MVRQQDDTDGGDALLAVNDVKAFAVRGLQDQIAHIMAGFLIGRVQGEEILPEVVPFVGGPGVIPLKGWHPVEQTIAHELAEGVVGGVEVHGRRFLFFFVAQVTLLASFDRMVRGRHGVLLDWVEGRFPGKISRCRRKNGVAVLQNRFLPLQNDFFLLQDEFCLLRSLFLLLQDDFRRFGKSFSRYGGDSPLAGRFFLVQGEEILPEVVPFVGGPGVIPLKGWYLVEQTIAHELAEGVVSGVEVHGSCSVFGI